MSGSSFVPFRSRRVGASLLVFMLAIAATVGFYLAVDQYAPADSLLVRYCCAHPVEYIEVGMFLWGMLALAAKWWELRRQRRALRAGLLPAWDGRRVPASEARAHQTHLDRLPRGLQRSVAGQRVHGALDFVSKRGSAEGLDEHLRNQADADADAADGSYALIRFITWAIPILGFLGTVLGITAAIAFVTPEQLAKSITGVTDGLALAFDTTAIALGFSMALMFFTFVLDRGEQGLLAAVDGYVDRELAHRFERPAGEHGAVAEVVRQNSQALLQTTERLVERQAEVWARSLNELRTKAESTQKEQQQQLTVALRNLLEQTVQAHERRLAAAEKQVHDRTTQVLQHFDRLGQTLRETTAALQQQSKQLAQQAAGFQPILEAEQQVLRLQATMQQNLQQLAQGGAFQQAVHSLTAAIHLLTARTESRDPSPAFRVVPKQGQAA